MLRKIIVERNRVALGVAEILAHGTRGIWRDVLQRSRLRRRGGHHDGVLHGAGIGEGLHDLRDRRTLLADGAVNANYVAALLIDDGVENDGGLPRLTVADDQLTLAAADGDHGVDGLDAGPERLANRLAIEHARRNALQRIALLRDDGRSEERRVG